MTWLDRIADYAAYILWLGVFALLGYMVAQQSAWYWGVVTFLAPPAIFLAWCAYGASEA